MSVPSIDGFEIVEKIGEGGMAVVWKARQVSLDRIVAVKMLSSRIKDNSSDADRFQSEARSAAKLKHPGIVQVHDAGTEKGHCYFVMEYVAGYTVGDWIRRKGSISEQETLVVAECVADALNYAWTTAGIIHCDVKPDNVIIDDDGTVKVADLGLARTINTMSADAAVDEVMGTPAYISPEQAEGKPDLDCRSDIYSLGAMMYHMLTGKLMFEGNPEEQVMELQVTTDPVDPKVLKPDLSDELHRLLGRLLAKDPALRPQTWTAAIEELSHVRRLLEARALKGVGGARKPGRRISIDHNRLAAMAAHRIASDGAAAPWLRRLFLLGGVVVIAVLALVAHRRSSDRVAGPTHPPSAVQRTAPTPAVPGPVSEAESPPAATGPAFDARQPETAPAAAGEGSEESVPPSSATVVDPAEEMLDFARTWAREHSGLEREAIKRFARVAEDTRGTKYALMAEEEIERLEKAIKEDVAGVMEGLAAAVRPLVASSNLLGAARVYDDYDGPLAMETRPRRADAAMSLRKRHRDMRMEDMFAQRKSERKVKDALGELADRLLVDGTDGALTLVGGLVNDPELEPDREDLQQIADLLRSAASIDQRILESFKAQKGVEVTLDFVQGRRTLSIVDVQGDRIIGCQMLKTGAGFASSEMVFGLADLSPRERMSRMGPDTDPEVALVKGLMAFRAKSYVHARNYFEAIGTPLSHELLQRVDQQEGVGSSFGTNPGP